MGTAGAAGHDEVMSQQTDNQTVPDGKRLVDQVDERARQTGIVRYHQGRIIAGVARGVALRYNVDPVIVRVALAILGVAGVGLALYLACWIMFPDEDGQTVLGRAVNGKDGSAIALIVIGALIAVPLGFSFADGQGGRVLGLLVVAGVAWLIYRSKHPAPPVGPGAGTTPVWAEPGSTAAPTASAELPPYRPVDRMPVITPWGGREGAYGDSAPATAPLGINQTTLTATPPPTVPAPVRTPAPRRRSLGGKLWLIAIGLIALLSGVRPLAESRGVHPLQAGSLMFGAMAIGLGLLIALVAALGYRSSGVSSLAVVAAVLALATPVALSQIDLNAPMGDHTWAPTSAAALQSEYTISLGEGVLDLTTMPAADLDGKTVAAKVGMGELLIKVPADVAVRIDYKVGLGELTVYDQGKQVKDFTGAGVSVPPLVLGEGTGKTMTLQMDVGMGTAKVERIAR